MAITQVTGQNHTDGNNTATGSLGTSLPSGITQGNLVVTVLKSGAASVAITPPDASWKAAITENGNGTNTRTVAIYYLVVDAAHAGQTSWTWTFGSSHSVAALTREWNATNGWPASPVDVTASNPSTTIDTVISSGTTATTTQAEELWVAILDYGDAPQTESGVTAGWTTGNEWAGATGTATVTEMYQVAAATGAAAVSYTIGVGKLDCNAIATFKDNPAGAPATVAGSRHGAWPVAPLRTITRQSLWPKEHNVAGVNLTDAAYGLNVEFYGEPAPQIIFTAHGQWPMAPVRTITRSALWTHTPGYNATTAGVNENDETRGVVDQFYGILDTYGVQQMPATALVASSALAETSAQVVDPAIPVQAQSALVESGAQVVDPAIPLVASSSLVENSAQVVDPAIPTVASSALVETAAQVVEPTIPVQASSLITESAQVVEPAIPVVASSVLSETSAQVVDPSAPLIASSVISEKAQLVEPVAAAQASSALVETAGQVVDPAIPVVASSVLNVTGSSVSGGTVIVSGDVSVAVVLLQTCDLVATALQTCDLAAVALDVVGGVSSELVTCDVAAVELVTVDLAAIAA